MISPSFTIKRSELTKSGSLSSLHITLIKNDLMRGAMVLLPSDTCYSLATLASSAQNFDNINLLLNRKKEPISLAFPNFSRVLEWIEHDHVTLTLLEKFTPGPITIVCRAKMNVPEKFTTKTIGSNNRTIGVRIPDSVIERDIASCTNYLITTVAIRYPENNEVVQNFEHALEIVGNGIEKIENTYWDAIEGGTFYSNHSTVVRVVDGPEKLKLIREGDINFNEIKALSNTISTWAYIDDEYL